MTLVQLVLEVSPDMWTALRQWWLDASRQVDSSSRRGQGCVPAASIHETPKVVDVPAPRGLGGPGPPDAAVVRDFTAMLLGVTALCERELTAIEQSVLERLDDTARAGGEEPLVPRLPAVLPKLMRLIRRDDMAVRELTELLGREPALLGEVMRIANSPFYLGTQTLTSLDAAIATLGQRGIHHVVTRAVMTPVFDLRQGRFSATAGTLLWDQAEGCAQACALRRAGAADQFDAYLAGMVANTGLIVALRLLDQHQASAAPASLAFHDQLAALSARLSARIARQWRFPDAVVLAVESLAQPADVCEVSGLAAELRMADRASKARVLASLGTGSLRSSPPDRAVLRQSV